MRQLKVIGLTGRAGSGKDTVGAMLRLYDFHRLAFGDGVRREVAAALRSREPLPSCISGECIAELWNLWEPEDVWKKPYGPDMRSLLQQWGTEHRRAQDPSYWIRMAEAIMARLCSRVVCPRIVITDVRFDNEATWIQSLGGEVWRVERPGIEQNSHVSEEPISDHLVSRTINNAGDQYALAELVYDAVCKSQVMV